MNFKEYVMAAIRTESEFHVMDSSTLVNEKLNDRLLHSAIGMQTELGEMFEALFLKTRGGKSLDIINLREELGDVMWYLAIACDNIGYYDLEFERYGDARFDDFHDYIYEINDITINILDSVKKSVFYKKPYDIELLISRLTQIFQLSGHLSQLLDWDLHKLCEINIEKLKARYPEKFTTHHAIHRDLGSEREILES